MDTFSSPRVRGLAFLDGGGELAELIAGFDWSATSVGPIDQWSQTMRTTVALMLRSPVPLVTLWGDKGVMIYNDAYADFAGGRHPQILGMDVLGGWPEVAEWNAKVVDTVFRHGETLSVEDLELTLYRNGIGEPVWMNLDYSPVVDDDGTPVAVIAIVVETTSKVLAQRELTDQRERLERMFDQAPGFVALLEGENHRFAMANRAYFALVGDREIIGRPVVDALPEVAEQGFVKLLDEVYRSRQPFIGQATPVLLKRQDDTGDDDERFVDFIYQPLFDGAGRLTGIFVQGQDVTERQRFERHQQLLVGELNHRVKNTLAIVQSLAHQSFHANIAPEEAIARFNGRLQALSGAHNLLTQESWEATSIREIVSAALRPFCSANRCHVSGPDVRLQPQTAVSLALALHELATNASKYGALSNDKGTISVDWSAGDDLIFTWTERGGPPVDVPHSRGFGTRMIERTVSAEFGGKVILDFRPDGVVCRVVAPIPAPSA